MRYPKPLQKNETIGFVAPSFGCNIEPYHTAFKSAQNKFQEMGYGIDIGPNCYLGEGIGISNTPKLCGKELTESYCGKENHAIISCGGGMALRDENAAIMKEAGTVVWLKARPETILKRVKHDDKRPLLRGNKNVEFIGNLLNQRSPKYESASHFYVNTDNRSIQSISEEILKRVGRTLNKA